MKTNRGPAKDRSLELYEQSLCKYPLLDKEKTYELIEKAQNGSKAAMDRLLLHNQRLVLKIARKFYFLNPQSHRVMEMMDLVQAGTFGLQKAIEDFDLERGGALSTYATHWIMQKIDRAVKEEYFSVRRLPVHWHETAAKWKKLLGAIEKMDLDFDLDDPIPFLDGLTLREIQERVNIGEYSVSLDTPIYADGGNDEITLEEALADPSAHLFAEYPRLYLEEKLLLLAETKLTEQEKNVLLAYLGIPLRRPETPEEIGERFELSKERAEEIIEVALLKLKNVYEKPDSECETARYDCLFERGGNVEELFETSGLSDREKYIVRARAGLLDGKKHTLEETSQAVGVTRERIRQIERAAIQKLSGEYQLLKEKRAEEKLAKRAEAKLAKEKCAEEKLAEAKHAKEKSAEEKLAKRAEAKHAKEKSAEEKLAKRAKRAERAPAKYKGIFIEGADPEMLMETAGLTDGEKRVVRSRAGLLDGRVHTQSELDKELGLGLGVVYRIEERALKKLKGEYQSREEGRAERALAKYKDIFIEGANPEILMETAGLTDGEKRVVRSCGGINQVSQPLEELCRALNISRPTLRQIEKRAIQKLRGEYRPIITAREKARKRPLLDSLTNAVCDFYNLKIDEIMGQTREARVAMPRQILMFLMRQETALSFPAIAKEVGRKDHTTVMHACAKIGEEIEFNPQLKEVMETIKQKAHKECP